MPSIHQNDLTMKAFIEEENSLKKVQSRILKLYEGLRDPRMVEEWDLYIKKSEIVNSRAPELSELEEFLVKNVHRLAQRLSENHLMNSFSFSKTFRWNPQDPSEFRESFAASSIADHCKTLLDDKSLPDKAGLSKLANITNRSSVDEKSRGEGGGEGVNWEHISVINQQTVLLEKKVEIYGKRIL
jgi:hypothetical protein